MRILWTALALMLAAAPAGAAGCPQSPAAERQSCIDRLGTEADEAVAIARRDALKATETWDGALDGEDRRQWAEKLGAMFDLWLAFRDRTCAAALLGFERRLAAERAEAASAECRLAVSRVIADDVANRFGEALAGLGRGSFATRPSGEDRRGLIAAEGRRPLCRDPGTGGDYEGLTACYERHAGRADAELNAVWPRVLAAIRARTDLSPARREAWVEALRQAQRAWAGLRDLACPLEAYETPNRFAHSIYSGIVGPCLIVETEARIRDLKRRYGLR